MRHYAARGSRACCQLTPCCCGSFAESTGLDIDGDTYPPGGRTFADGALGSLLVCDAWANTAFGYSPLLWGKDNHLKNCGIMKSSPCLDGAGTVIPGAAFARTAACHGAEPCVAQIATGTPVATTWSSRPSPTCTATGTAPSTLDSPSRPS